MTEVLRGLDKVGTVVLLSDGPVEVNVALRDAADSWAVGGHPEPWSDEKLAAGIEKRDACVVVIHEGGTL